MRMRTRLLLAAAVVGLLAWPVLTYAADPPGPPDRVRLLVHMQLGADRGPVRAFTSEQGGIVKHEYEVVMPNVINVRNLPAGAVAALEKVPGVARVEEDRYVENAISMDDSTPLIRGLQSQITGAGYSADGAGIRVCIVDTGIDSDHIMYETRIDTAAGWDFANDDSNPEDDNGHGSHVAGTAVGRTGLTLPQCEGNKPFQGVAPEATLIGVKVLNSAGGGYDSDIIAGINHCADPALPNGQADVINLSLGDPGAIQSGVCDSHSWSVAANNAVDAGVVVVVATGNECETNAFRPPACASKTVAVGATYDESFPNCDDSTSSFGGFPWYCYSDDSPSVDQICGFSNQGDELDVTAPGCVTTSASTSSPTSVVPNCGTSMAAPHVTGLAALILDMDPALTPAEVRQIIRDGAIDMGPTGFDRAYGYGRIDVLNSLALVAPCQTNEDCDDGLYCNGAETCDAGTCQPGTPVTCNDGVGCTDDSCNETTDSCDYVPNDANCDDGVGCTDDTCDAVSDCQYTPNDANCDDGVGCTDDTCDAVNDCQFTPNDANCPDNGLFCDGTEYCDSVNDCVSTGDPCEPGEDCDEVNDVCVPGSCDNDDVCETGEDCHNCPNDCFEGSGAVCGNGVCETADGEDCASCPDDCNSYLTGAPGGRYCCGDGTAKYGVTCDDSRCTGGGNTCTTEPAVPSCCGDGVCEGTEDVYNCAVDCGCTTPADCDDANECTVDDCVGGVCENTPVADDTPCAGGICCDGTCDAAVCSSDGDCTDGEACTTDTCYNADTCSAYCDNVWPACGLSDGCCGPTCDSGNDPDCDTCVPAGGYCTTNEECCSGSCHPAKNYCR